MKVATCPACASLLPYDGLPPSECVACGWNFLEAFRAYLRGEKTLAQIGADFGSLATPKESPA